MSLLVSRYQSNWLSSPGRQVDSERREWRNWRERGEKDGGEGERQFDVHRHEWGGRGGTKGRRGRLCEENSIREQISRTTGRRLIVTYTVPYRREK